MGKNSGINKIFTCKCKKKYTCNSYMKHIKKCPIIKKLCNHKSIFPFIQPQIKFPINYSELTKFNIQFSLII